ncbi:MAG: geranylgeranylglycerol-phosphate geranylgeranyltransferase, partial [Bacteroidota bacterium]
IVNKPERVVIGKSIRRRVAMGANVVINTLALLIALSLGWRIFTVIIGAIFLLWLYSNRLKRLPFLGNLSIALLTALTLFIIAVYYQAQEGVLYIYASFAFFITLIREIIKDMEDMKGDQAFDCYTLPIMWGVRKTKLLLFALIVSFIANLAISFFFLDRWVVIYLSGIIFFPVAWLIVRLYRADRVKDYAFLSTFCKVIMLIGVLSIALHF